MNDHLYTTTIYSCYFMALKVLVKSGSCLTDDVSSICQQKHVHKHTMGWFFIVLCPNALLFMSANLFKLCARVWFFFGRAKGWKWFYGLFVLSTMVNILCSCSKVKVQCYLMYSLLVSHLMISHQNHLLILVSTHQVNCFLIYVTIQENIHNKITLFISLIIALIHINAIKAKQIEVKGLSPAVNNHSIDASLNMIHSLIVYNM